MMNAPATRIYGEDGEVKTAESRTTNKLFIDSATPRGELDLRIVARNEEGESEPEVHRQARPEIYRAVMAKRSQILRWRNVSPKT
jgi:hypothetical protein